MDFARILITMKTAALEAGKMLLEMQPAAQHLPSKKDFLSDADLKSDEIILDVLAKAYPDIPAYSEENGEGRRATGYQWIIDPVDGTINYWRQMDHWGVSIALAKDGQTVAAVILLPRKGELFMASASEIVAQRMRYNPSAHSPSEGAQNIRVSGRQLAEAQFWFGWGKESRGGADHENVLALMKRVDAEAPYPQIRNSATADIMMVAEGKIEGYVFANPEPFDIAAAGLIVERAGGKVTDMDGNPWSPFSEGIIASNGIVHDELLHIIRE